MKPGRVALLPRFCDSSAGAAGSGRGRFTPRKRPGGKNREIPWKHHDIRINIRKNDDR